jgi:hydroxymethylglutaryl-CoA reductase
VHSARELAEVCACAGLASNLAALRALSSEGIQRGHMGLHARQIAMSAGAPPALVEFVAEQLIAEGCIKPARAQQIVDELLLQNPSAGQPRPEKVPV